MGHLDVYEGAEVETDIKLLDRDGYARTSLCGLDVPAEDVNVEGVPAEDVLNGMSSAGT